MRLRGVVKGYPFITRVEYTELDKLDVARDYVRVKFDPLLVRHDIDDLEGYWASAETPYITVPSAAGLRPDDGNYPAVCVYYNSKPVCPAGPGTFNSSMNRRFTRSGWAIASSAAIIAPVRTP